MPELSRATLILWALRIWPIFIDQPIILIYLVTLCMRSLLLLACMKRDGLVGASINYVVNCVGRQGVSVMTIYWNYTLRGLPGGGGQKILKNQPRCLWVAPRNGIPEHFKITIYSIRTERFVCAINVVILIYFEKSTRDK